MKTIIYYLIAIIFLFSSCTMHEEIVDTSFQIGNIYCSDGSIIHPSLFQGSGKTAVGIVFWCNDWSQPEITDIGYAVALTDLESDYLIGEQEDIANVSEDETAFNGASNTTAIKVFAIEDSIPYPAVEKVFSFVPAGVTGWFIGSAGQTKQLSVNIAKVHDSMKLVGGQMLNGWYWTSTEDGAGKDTPMMFALILSVTEGRITTSDKKSINKIRPIISIR